MNSTDVNILIQYLLVDKCTYLSWVYNQSGIASSEACNCLAFVGVSHFPQRLLIYTPTAIYKTSSCFTFSQIVAIGLQNVHILIPGTCKYVIFPGKKNFGDPYWKSTINSVSF